MPEHWNIIPLKKVSQRMQNGSTPPTETPEYYVEDGLPWYGPSSLGQAIAIGKPVKYVSNLAVHAGKVRLINPPALVVSVIGNVGRSALMLDLGATNQQITCFELCTNLVVPEFIAYQFRLAETALISFSSSSTISIIDTSLLRSTRIAFPQTISEQSTIVRYLNYIDRRIRRYIRSKQKLIKLLEEQKQAVIHQAVTRGLDPNVKLKPSGVDWLGDVPEHWEVMALRRVTLARCDGPFGSGLKSSHYTDQGIRVVRLTNIGHAEFRNSDVAFISPMHYVSLGDHSVKTDDVLIAGLGDERHPAGRACVAPAEILPAMVKADCFRFRLKKDRINPKFAAIQLTATAVAASAILSTGATRQRINLQSTAGRMIAIPSLLEQERILDYISENTSNLNIAIDRTHHEISLLREYRTRLIADVVTGKLDVREAAVNLPEETDETESFDDSLPEDDDLENSEIENDQAGELE